jgi:hypothetical protein
MDDEKLRRAADWLRSTLTSGILSPFADLQLSAVGPNSYELKFATNGTNKFFPMPAAWVEGIADGNEEIQSLVKGNLLTLARM